MRLRAASGEDGTGVGGGRGFLRSGAAFSPMESHSDCFGGKARGGADYPRRLRFMKNSAHIPQGRHEGFWFSLGTAPVLGGGLFHPCRRAVSCEAALRILSNGEACPPCGGDSGYFPIPLREMMSGMTTGGSPPLQKKTRRSRDQSQDRRALLSP